MNHLMEWLNHKILVIKIFLPFRRAWLAFALHAVLAHCGFCTTQLDAPLGAPTISTAEGYSHASLTVHKQKNGAVSALPFLEQDTKTYQVY